MREASSVSNIPETLVYQPEFMEALDFRPSSSSSSSSNAACSGQKLAGASTMMAVAMALASGPCAFPADRPSQE